MGPDEDFSLLDFAVPATVVLIFFLSYTSQFLFHYIDPGPLTLNQALWFNGIVLGIWWCYERACTVDPGLKGWTWRANPSGEKPLPESGLRWCKKCDAVKPPRAHHCKKCGRCIPRMDHHCPWIGNCVSYTNFPHFIRFILYAVVAMSVLCYHLAIRLMALWDNRNLPAYLGPPVWGMAHLLCLLLTNSLTLFSLVLMLYRAVASLTMNITMIESWEIERHEALVERARRMGGFVYGNGGQRVVIEYQEFPYDIGVWKNICQAMGTRNILMWFLPFGGAPDIEGAVKWEVNGFESEDKVWPPIDPDKMPREKYARSSYDGRQLYGNVANGAMSSGHELRSNAEEMAAFKERQRKDYTRWRVEELEDDYEEEEEEEEEGPEVKLRGQGSDQIWRNSDGETLRDFGVDSDTEMTDDEDVPLGELVRRRKARAVQE